MDECLRDSINVSDVIDEEKEELSFILKLKFKKRIVLLVSDEKFKKRRKLIDKFIVSFKLKLFLVKFKFKIVYYL